MIVEHLLRCDADFMPSLSSRVLINDYAKKIANNAMRFEAYSGDAMVGLVAVYCNDRDGRIAYVTNSSVLKEWNGKGIATRLMQQCIEHAKTSGMQQISLEVAIDNIPAIKLYVNKGFVAGEANTPFVSMSYHFNSKDEYDQKT